jgi:hypothetical protein
VPLVTNVFPLGLFGLIVGVAICWYTVYDTAVGALFPMPDFTAMALNVTLPRVEYTTAPVYKVELVVGVEPSVEK